MSAEIPVPGLPEVGTRGFQTPVRELGAANALRFLDLCGIRHGEGERWLSGLTAEQAEEEIHRMKARGGI